MNQSLGKLSPMRDDELNNEDDLIDEDFDLDEGGLDDAAGAIEDDDRLLAEEPDVSDLEEIEIEEEDESDLDAGLDLGDDPVRMYLKEIGQVRLLDPQQEVWLAIQMSGADQLDRVRERLHAANKKSPPLAELMLGVYEDFIAAWDHLDKLGRK
ncbi:MAG TPA: sigma-70 factor domain-containing protein, partial [Anaerolineae bacterium]|nr:sigma-70 factor domain-containing protein [Anaerolineae bacterium]